VRNYEVQKGLGVSRKLVLFKAMRHAQNTVTYSLKFYMGEHTNNIDNQIDATITVY